MLFVIEAQASSPAMFGAQAPRLLCLGAQAPRLLCIGAQAPRLLCLKLQARTPALQKRTLRQKLFIRFDAIEIGAFV